MASDMAQEEVGERGRLSFTFSLREIFPSKRIFTSEKSKQANLLREKRRCTVRLVCVLSSGRSKQVLRNRNRSSSVVSERQCTTWV